MSDHIIDARGLPCPQPVILTKKGLNDPSSDVITVIVDNDTAMRNVSLLADKIGAMYTSESRNDGFYITLSRTPSPGPAGSAGAQPDASETAEKRIPGTEGTAAVPISESSGVARPGPDRLVPPTSVLVVNSAHMGRGSDELGGILIRGFFHALVETDSKPGTIIFYNSGVELTAAGSPVIDDLLELEKYGVTLLACGTCLEYFGLKDSLGVGTVTNMYTITETLLEAQKIVNL